jgi:hypothetical protein
MTVAERSLPQCCGNPGTLQHSGAEISYLRSMQAIRGLVNPQIEYA